MRLSLAYEDQAAARGRRRQLVAERTATGAAVVLNLEAILTNALVTAGQVVTHLLTLVLYRAFVHICNQSREGCTPDRPHSSNVHMKRATGMGGKCVDVNSSSGIKGYV